MAAIAVRTRWFKLSIPRIRLTAMNPVGFSGIRGCIYYILPHVNNPSAALCQYLFQLFLNLSESQHHSLWLAAQPLTGSTSLEHESTVEWLLPSLYANNYSYRISKRQFYEIIPSPFLEISNSDDSGDVKLPPSWHI